MGQEHSAVKNEFTSAGFVSVTVEPIEDLKMIDTEKVNAVESVSVGGTTDFSKGQKFDKNDEVIIRYHAYKNVMSRSMWTLFPTWYSANTMWICL